MSLLGHYLVLKVNDSVIAETTNINIKMVAKKLESTSQSSGVYSSFEPGTVKIGIAGTFLLATSHTNWSALYDKMKIGDEVEAGIWVNGSELFSGFGIIKRLSLKGADESSLITGSYAIRYNPSQTDPYTILTEAGIEITTETGEEITVE